MRQLASATGDLTLARTYDPFGGLLQQAAEGDALFGFMGAQAGGNGLLYINGRYYDPATGRFLSPDNSNFDPMRPGTPTRTSGNANSRTYFDSIRAELWEYLWRLRLVLNGR